MSSKIERLVQAIRGRPADYVPFWLTRKDEADKPFPLRAGQIWARNQAEAEERLRQGRMPGDDQLTFYQPDPRFLARAVRVLGIMGDPLLGRARLLSVVTTRTKSLRPSCLGTASCPNTCFTAVPATPSWSVGRSSNQGV
jgi:hypothetical protein